MLRYLVSMSLWRLSCSTGLARYSVRIRRMQHFFKLTELGIIGIGAGKVSVSALLLAIMRSSHRAWQKTYLWTFCVILVCCISVSCSILTISQCKPVAALWDSRIRGACINPSIIAKFDIFTGCKFSSWMLARC
jgi:hypothetical protein